MDFSYNEDQEAVGELIGQILEDRCSLDRSKEVEATDAWFDEDLWQDIVKASLAGLTIPEEFGGSGFGLIEACLALEATGRYCAPIPLLAHLITGAMPIAEFGSLEQKKKWLIPAAESGAILTAALAEVGLSNPAHPRVTATPDGDGWRLQGEKTSVPAAAGASAILVPAATSADDVGIFIVEPGAEGVEIELQRAINWERQGQLRLAGVRVGADALLGDASSGRAMVEWIVDRAQVGIAATMVGIAYEATRQTAAYLTERKQFGRPLGSFQATQMRLADAYIDTEAIRAVTVQAAWRLEEGLRARAEVRSAKWWACRAGDRVVHSAQHLHGGIGSDADYPIHRYFLAAMQLMATLGGSNQQLAELGAMLVSDEERPIL